MIELLPCPFCGAEAESILFTEPSFVECKECSGSAHIDDWNTRVFRGAKNMSSESFESIQPSTPEDS